MSSTFSFTKYVNNDGLQTAVDKWCTGYFHDPDMHPSLYLKQDGRMEIELYHADPGSMDSKADRLIRSLFDVFGAPDGFDLDDAIAKLHAGGVLTIPDLTAMPIVMAAVIDQSDDLTVLTADLDDSGKAGLLFAVT